jgi:chlorophyll(ide) b reductase
MGWFGALLGGILLCCFFYIKSYWPKQNNDKSRQFAVLITGGTRGVGFALAKKFLEMGDKVVITGRTQATIDAALSKLRGANADRVVFGVRCEIRDFKSVHTAFVAAKSKLGTDTELDIVIHNAGAAQSKSANVVDTDADELRAIVDTNLVGSLLVAKEALQTFKNAGKGMLWLTDGAGARGRATPQFAAYGASKAGIPQLAQSLKKEIENSNLPIEIGVKVSRVLQ